MDDKLNQDDWDLLLDRIKDGKCTPFLGAGACHGLLPMGATIAEEWAKKFDYPMDDRSDLARVAQFLAVNTDSMRPKDWMAEVFKNALPADDSLPPAFADPNEIHNILADLPLPIYITTNYDNFMFKALEKQGKKPSLEVCRWNKRIRDMLKKAPNALKSGSQVTERNPVVFHLHGQIGLRESMVLTEDDYLDFLVNISRDKNVLPPRIEEAMAGTSLLFLGYRLNDWDFRVLFRSLVSYLPYSIGRAHVSVQLVPVKTSAPDEQRQKAQKYLHRYFDNLKIRVYWGTCQEFAQELKHRWEKYNGK